MFPEDQVTELKELCPELKLASEGGIAYLLMPALALPDGCTPARSDALLSPTPAHGYPSRLFFPQIIECKAKKVPNWNGKNIHILDRTWQTYSWNVKPGLRLAQILLEHMRALRCI